MRRFSISSAMPIPALVEAVREGRKEEFGAFASEGRPPRSPVDRDILSAQDRSGKRCLRKSRRPVRILQGTLIAMRKNIPALSVPESDAFRVWPWKRRIWPWWKDGRATARRLCLFNFNETDVSVRLPAPRNPVEQATGFVRLGMGRTGYGTAGKGGRAGPMPSCADEAARFTWRRRTDHGKIHLHSRPFLPASQGKPLAGGRGDPGFGSPLPRLERADHRRMLRAQLRVPHPRW